MVGFIAIMVFQVGELTLTKTEKEKQMEKENICDPHKTCVVYMKNYKDGVADAVLYGNMADRYGDGYKAGYDFGITIYCRLEYGEEES